MEERGEEGSPVNFCGLEPGDVEPGAQDVGSLHVLGKGKGPGQKGAVAPGVLVSPGHVFLRRTPFQKYFEEAMHDLRSERVEAFDLNFRAEAVAFIDGLMATYAHSGIAVYKWDEDLNFRRARTIKRSLLQFLVKTGSLCGESVSVLLQILLFLIRSGVERCDLFMEQAMLHLEIEKVLGMRIAGRELHCEYASLVTKVYDQGLRLIRKYVTGDKARAPEKIAYEDVEISVEGDCVVIDRKRSFVERIRVGEIRQFLPFGKSLFLLTDQGMKVLRFAG